MSKQDGGGPAFACAGSEDRTQGDMPDGNKYLPGNKGMSLRDYFAAAALPALSHGKSGLENHDVAQAAYALADAMLAERSREK